MGGGWNLAEPTTLGECAMGHRIWPKNITIDRNSSRRGPVVSREDVAASLFLLGFGMYWQMFVKPKTPWNTHEYQGKKRKVVGCR